MSQCSTAGRHRHEFLTRAPPSCLVGPADLLIVAAHLWTSPRASCRKRRPALQRGTRRTHRRSIGARHCSTPLPTRPPSTKAWGYGSGVHTVAANAGQVSQFTDRLACRRARRAALRVRQVPRGPFPRSRHPARPRARHDSSIAARRDSWRGGDRPCVGRVPGADGHNAAAGGRSGSCRHRRYSLDDAQGTRGLWRPDDNSRDDVPNVLVHSTAPRPTQLRVRTRRLRWRPLSARTTPCTGALLRGDGHSSPTGTKWCRSGQALADRAKCRPATCPWPPPAAPRVAPRRAAGSTPANGQRCDRRRQSRRWLAEIAHDRLLCHASIRREKLSITACR